MKGRLVKGAYTGIAASIIDGKTLYVLAGIGINGREPGAHTLKKLAQFWKGKDYLIIDEKSMVGRRFFAQISKAISRAKCLNGEGDPDKPFGGLNVILVGDFHQFPPMVSKRSAPLYYPTNPSKDSPEEMLGRSIYERFTVVVRLKQQVRVKDALWTELLQHVRHGNCRAHHIEMLRSLVVTDPSCPKTDFSTPPWDNHVLVTPRHSVRRRWNEQMARAMAKRNNLTLFVCKAYDCIGGRDLMLREKFAVASKDSKGGGRQDERAGLPNVVELANGMQVMVTFNVKTDLDVANGSRGEIVGIKLDSRETRDFSMEEPEGIVKLQFLPVYVWVKLHRTKASRLEGLEEGVVPVVPLERTFRIRQGGGEKTVTRHQLPLTPAYAFTDYRSQGQTIDKLIVDIGTPPSGQLTPFNAYVALSRSRGRDSIQLLRGFDERLFTTHPNEYLREEDERLETLDRRTTQWWQNIHH